ncbi:MULTISPECIES: CoA-binding protein [Aneurinibacillus]|uniref:CoA-binding protein n=1 Tax=Aneurinibacillus thermoaerophilus TaxID=143495 RepID=A0A1G7WUY9_ANETH|nr:MULTISPECIES: CoA-binding protein [Aneurinibacillus]AMA73943.1 CoA-binding protein [Aneurinibacillus sp. XH2]MED0676193.1 CoA-binding protein [Aneurinibacillus thermoaerophilus]MED0678124.1 CoA-binding protein [Aneurinibacillus thermoaerophilus]MED0737689.1 CoA-binding protein [Aneurinibacillus thermoaerophilus]MED0755681.1 CoA-binding protein [Aneurinibacillus thermoaerophilus]
MAFMNPSNEERRKILEEAKTIAVVGLSNKPERTSYMVSQAMQNNGYKIIPVNPTIEESLGEKAVSSLTEIKEPVDIVNVFRRSEEVGPVVDDAIKIKPKVIWMQQGVYNEEAAKKAQEAGITVVMDQCIKVDHALLVRK